MLELLVCAFLQKNIYREYCLLSFIWRSNKLSIFHSFKGNICDTVCGSILLNEFEKLFISLCDIIRWLLRLQWLRWLWWFASQDQECCQVKTTFINVTLYKLKTLPMTRCPIWGFSFRVGLLQNIAWWHFVKFCFV
jgi:hypothetical protein